MSNASVPSRRWHNYMWPAVQAAVFLLIGRVTVGIVVGYRDYLPPNFYSEFLSGRREYFYGLYQYAFWAHITSTPLAMMSGTVLLSKRVRLAWPMAHRTLGRIHVIVLLFLVCPSSLWMSMYALTGPVAGSAFAVSALALGVCAALGWRNALKRRFKHHQQWMMRGYLLMCSAILLRLLSGAASVLDWQVLWSYPLFAWISTLVPVAVYELWRVRAIPKGSERLAGG